MQTRNLSILSQQTAAYNTTNAFVNVPGFVITIPEDGNYDVFAYFNATNDNNADVTYNQLAKNGSNLGVGCGYFTDTTYGTAGFMMAAINEPLKKDDVVSLQAAYGGSATVIPYAAGSKVGWIKIIKRGV